MSQDITDLTKMNTKVLLLISENGIPTIENEIPTSEKSSTFVFIISAIELINGSSQWMNGIVLCMELASSLTRDRARRRAAHFGYAAELAFGKSCAK